MEGAENISPPQSRIKITELSPGGTKLIETNPPGSQRIESDAISIRDPNTPTAITVISVLDKERNTLKTSYEILPDGRVIQYEHNPDKPGEIVKRTPLENVLAAGIITTYGPPEERQKDGETKIVEPVVKKRELVLVPKGNNP